VGWGCFEGGEQGFLWKLRLWGGGGVFVFGVFFGGVCSFLWFMGGLFLRGFLFLVVFGGGGWYLWGGGGGFLSICVRGRGICALGCCSVWGGRGGRTVEFVSVAGVICVWVLGTKVCFGDFCVLSFF